MGNFSAATIKFILKKAITEWNFIPNTVLLTYCIERWKHWLFFDAMSYYNVVIVLVPIGYEFSVVHPYVMQWNAPILQIPTGVV